MSNALMGLFWLLVIGAIYFIPSFVACGKRNAGAIFVLNLLLGWTGLGWLGALIWAMVEKPRKDTFKNNRRKH